MRAADIEMLHPGVGDPIDQRLAFAHIEQTGAIGGQRAFACALLLQGAQYARQPCILTRLTAGYRHAGVKRR